MNAEPTVLLDLVKLVFEKHGKRQGLKCKARRPSPGARIIRTPGEVKSPELLASQLFDLFDQLFGEQTRRRRLARQASGKRRTAKV